MKPSHPFASGQPADEVYQKNPELELAFDLVRFTNKSLFLTGKAGSGKTTFLKQIRRDGIKRMAIVAPTGVAAINAGGMTIHSLFQLPFGLHLPGIQRSQNEPTRRFSSNKLRLLRSLELLVIDEVSMVRADLLDAIDEVLKRYRSPLLPFGGVQLLMIGDLHQLPPVAKHDEWQILSKYYDSPYFFSSHALRQTDYQSVELKHIFRQSDPEFIELLNKVRDNRLDVASLRRLNTRFLPGFEPTKEEPYITLTTTNAVAQQINATNLDRLPDKPQMFEAQISGDFPPSSYPNEVKLEFKPGAQVMFIKNDQGTERRYYNGKIGQIARIEDNVIYVECPGDVEEIPVLPAEWQNVKYQLNEETKQIEEKVVGAFSQMPLKLAWAITIHKSQGLTFDRAMIDAQASFASGQVYVALSRCKTFEGIVLRTPLNESSVKTDHVVKRFTEQVIQQHPDNAFMVQARREYENQLLGELFDFTSVTGDFKKLGSLFAEHRKSLTEEAVQQLGSLAERATRDLEVVSKNFAQQLANYLASEHLPSENPDLLARLQKAAAYFVEKLNALMHDLRQVPTATDNQAVNLVIAAALRSLHLNLFTKRECFQVCSDKFSSGELLRARVNAELEMTKADLKVARTSGGFKVPQGVPHPELYRRLTAWRQEMAEERDVEPYEIFPSKTLRSLVDVLPLNLAAMKGVVGMGKVRLEWFGRELCELIANFCEETGTTGTKGNEKAPQKSERPKKAERGVRLSTTQQQTFEMFQAGKSIEEIATERKFAKTTIEGHLSEAVALGLINIERLLPVEALTEITEHAQSHPDTPLGDLKSHFGDKYTYGELRLALSHLRRNTSPSRLR